ncbi:TonB-dependent receptor [Parasphingorhabdus cellanae]|uniref:TonB-dependent receptor n=1 Tax=Parasphingorhabdus cellanae TaxID=2806553 RepID=A0ABX7T2V9_9SPHN|nr:TonB-dependent receptor [Parasphingorhabdus cellanae]QTD55896.1 TonB-dependent receptor [Parasphingorhabdus cellanae]
MQSRSFKMLQAAILASTANIAIVGSAHAQEQIMSFDMPDQSLSAALKDYALKTGKNLVYPPKMVADKRAKAVSGQLTPTQALRLLLRGTLISFREIRPNVVALSLNNKSQFQQNRTAATAAATASTPAVVQRASTLADIQDSPSSKDGATGVVSGTVVNTSTGVALKGALVRIDGTNLESVTDDRGQYYFPAVPRGQQMVRVEYLGEQVETVIISVSPGSRQQANVQIGQANQDIVVFGYRSSIQQALNKQKNVDNSATIVSSDLLGGFPAETVSEALRRVPGVAFGRDDATGEGSRVTVRGFSSEAINVQLNGIDLQGTSFERTVDLSGFLTDNISEITIHKSLLPSHEATGSGGLVEIETKSALDYGDFSLNFGIEGESGFDRKFGEEFEANGTISKKLAPNFGIAATLQYRKTNRLNFDANVNDIIPAILPAGFTSFGLVPVADFEFPFDPGVQQQIIFGANYNRRDRSEEAILGSINLAWDVADHTRLRLDLQRNVRDTQTLVSNTSVGFVLAGIDMPIPELNNEVRRRRTINQFRPAINLNTTDNKLTTSTISFRGDTDIDRWNFKYKAGYSRSVSKGNNSSIALIGKPASNVIDLVNGDTVIINPDDDAGQPPRVVDGVVVSVSNGLPAASLSAAGIDYLFDPSNYNVLRAQRTLIDSPTDSYVGEFSARYNTPLDFLNYVELGVKYDSRTRQTLDNPTNPAFSASSRYFRIFRRDTEASLLDGGNFFSQDLGIIGASGTDIPSLTRASSDLIFADLANFTADDPSTPDFNEERFVFDDFTQLDPILDGGGALFPTEVTEEKLAGYLQTKFELGDFNLIAGVRYEREKRDAFTITTPSLRFDNITVPQTDLIVAGLVDFNTQGATVETWTPSFLLTYRPIDNITARLGYFRSTVYPSIQLLNRSTTIQGDLRAANPRITIREANPDIKPTVTDNFDLDIAYYFDDTPGLIKFSLFYKKISNNFTNILNSFGNIASDEIVRDRYLEFFDPLVGQYPQITAIPDDTTYFFSRPENGEGGNIWGAEFEIIRRLDFLPGFLSDFGVLGNVTYTNAEFPTLVPIVEGVGADREFTQISLNRQLQDQAKWVYNISLDYERDGFQGRLIYTRQSSSGVIYDEFNLNTVTPAFATLDARFSYNFEKFGGLWTIFLEGDDLLTGSKEADIRSAVSSQFGDGDASFFYPQSFQFNGGRTVTFGIRAKF